MFRYIYVFKLPSCQFYDYIKKKKTAKCIKTDIESHNDSLKENETTAKEECVADIDLVRICQILTLDTIEHYYEITVLVQYCHKRKYNFNEA